MREKSEYTYSVGRATKHYDGCESNEARDKREDKLVRDILNDSESRRGQYQKMEQARQEFERNAPSPAEQERQERARQQQARADQARADQARADQAHAEQARARALEEEARRAFQTDMRRQIQSVFSGVAPVVGVQRPPLPAANALPVAPLGNRPAGQSNLKENSMFGTLHRQMTTDPQGVFAALNQQLGTFGHNRNIPDSTQNSNSSNTGLNRR